MNDLWSTAKSKAPAQKTTVAAMIRYRADMRARLCDAQLRSNHNSEKCPHCPPKTGILHSCSDVRLAPKSGMCRHRRLTLLQCKRPLMAVLLVTGPERPLASTA